MKEDSIGILAAIEDLKMQHKTHCKEAECHILQANITSYRSEIRQWLVSNQWQLACLQETHQAEASVDSMTASLISLARTLGLGC